MQPRFELTLLVDKVIPLRLGALVFAKNGFPSFNHHAVLIFGFEDMLLGNGMLDNTSGGSHIAS